MKFAYTSFHVNLAQLSQATGGNCFSLFYLIFHAIKVEYEFHKPDNCLDADGWHSAGQ